jgi:hypothetical protein
VLSIECNYDGVFKLGVATDTARITTVLTGACAAVAAMGCAHSVLC